MRNIVKLIGLLVLVMFSFFYTDRVISVIRETDPLMEEIDSVKDNYKIDYIDGVVIGDSIVPGINGRVVNLDLSYKKMRRDGVFSENKLVFDDVSPKNSLVNNRYKFIIGGNEKKNMVSIIFVVDDKKYLDKLNSVINAKNVFVNYFVPYDFLIENSSLIKSIKNVEFYSYGDNGMYTPDNLLFSNNLISRITSNNAIYCLSENKNKDVLNLCSNNGLYTVVPSIIASSSPYQEVRNKLSSGDIILINVNNNTIVEFGIIVDYIRGKGLKINYLSKLLSEDYS